MSKLQNTTRIEIVFSVVSFITPGLLYLVYASLRGFAEFDRIECWLSIVQELALCKTCVPVPLRRRETWLAVLRYRRRRIWLSVAIED